MLGPCFLSWDICHPWTFKWSLKDDQETKSTPRELIRQQSPTPWEDLQVDQEGLIAVVISDTPQPGISAGNPQNGACSYELWVDQYAPGWRVEMDTQAWPPMDLGGKPKEKLAAHLQRTGLF